MFTKTLTFLTLAAISAKAIITPTSPESATVVKVGDKINALWTVDSTDNWNNVQIQLMTGDNLQMVPLATVATGIDGTKVSSYSFDAPDVTPYSKIYFLQFTNGGLNPTWTTRFTIAGADGSTTEPTNSTVYSGTNVEWGTGTLLSSVSTDGSSSSNSTSSGSSNSTGVVSTISSSASSTASISASASASASESASESTSADSSSFTSGTASGSGSKTVAAAAASASSSGSTSDAGKKEVGIGMMLLAGLVGLTLL